MNDTRLNLWMPILWGAAVAVLLRFIPPCCFCSCFNALVGGAVAGGVLARRAVKSRQFPDASQGLLVGIGAGLACAVVGLVISLIIALAFGPEAAQRFLAGLSIDGAFKDALRRAIEVEMSTPVWLRATKALFVEIGGGVILGAIGGVLTMLLMRQPPSSPTPAGPVAATPWSGPAQSWTPPPVPPPLDPIPPSSPPPETQPPEEPRQG